MLTIIIKLFLSLAWAGLADLSICGYTNEVYSLDDPSRPAIIFHLKGHIIGAVLDTQIVSGWRPSHCSPYIMLNKYNTTELPKPLFCHTNTNTNTNEKQLYSGLVSKQPHLPNFLAQSKSSQLDCENFS